LINEEIKGMVWTGKSEQLKDKYTELEDNFSELKRQALLHETQGLVPAQPEEHEQGQPS